MTWVRRVGVRVGRKVFRLMNDERQVRDGELISSAIWWEKGAELQLTGVSSVQFTVETEILSSLP